MGAFFQELTPEIKVTVDENSERHSMVLEKSAFCPGIVLEFCKIILENMN